ncbi:MAG: sugar transferase [Pseudomonadota bacterium]
MSYLRSKPIEFGTYWRVSTSSGENQKVESSKTLKAKVPVGGRLKRGVDFILALSALIVCSPVLAVLAAIVRIASPGPVFYRHWRIGLNGEPFKCTKFRTMHVDADAHLKMHLAMDPAAAEEFRVFRKLKKDPRVVPVVGTVLRRWSLDELPQLLDVLRGRMSLVGPRPVTREELERYATVQFQYIQTRPGITGLWQVSGRNALSFQERVAIDRFYIENWSFLSDLSIMARTVTVLITGRGAC